MADFDSSLPVRTENAGDVIAKISDATVPSQQLKVESDGSINVNAAFSPGTEVIITDGTDDLAINADGSLNAVVSATDLDIRDLVFATDKVDVSGSSVTVSATDLDIRDLSSATDSITVLATDLDIRDLSSATDSVTAVATDFDIRDLSASQDNVAISDGTDTLAINADGSLNITDNGGSITVDGSVTVSATDLDIRDLTHASDSVKIGDGADFLAVNSDGSLNVVVVSEQDGTEVVDYQTSSAVAAGASTNHDYTVPGGVTFYGEELWISASGKLKAEVLVNGATKFVGFNSTANPNIRIPLEHLVKAAATQVVRITITNKDNQAQDVYSTLVGVTK